MGVKKKLKPETGNRRGSGEWLVTGGANFGFWMVDCGLKTMFNVGFWIFDGIQHSAFKI